MNAPSATYGRGRRAKAFAALADLAISHAAQAFGVPAAQIAGRVRLKPISRARYAAFAIVRDTSGIGLIPLGRLFAGRDHTTVLDALRRHRRLCETDAEHRRRSLAAYEGARPGAVALLAEIGCTVPGDGAVPAVESADPFAGVRYDTAYRNSGAVAAPEVKAFGVRGDA